jgi:hypothetical protein
MLKFISKCLVIKTKYDDGNKYIEQNTQCNIQTHQQSVYCQCEKTCMVDKAIQCDWEENTQLATNRQVFLRDKVICNMPFTVHDTNGEKYILIKGVQVFLRHIKGYFKYDAPWNM